ncbi:triose-phosphate isomerase [Tissierella creatinophila]|uniref:Triosephosphate isomerase n=1 Tax=Tissierella creatinophila DSM 6911 TaxID=1123403 RepID=A0A1U7M9F2_TISCR|nr:triose-phosphate isomerase [Tissierella creatinophila]OLS03839.1 triosephosphate isomerase [Tissierella creatinophila DSM 6911]
MRTPIIAGNWKMHNNIEESLKLVRAIKSYDLAKNVEKVVCVPFTDLKSVKEEIKGTDIKLGAQNMHFEESGAYTGEISASMLKEIGVDYVIIGHSERREYFNETDETVNKKIKTAIKHNIKPILCVGETLEQREANEQKKIVKTQIEGALKDIETRDIEEIVVAYEPIWAIGTGKTASSIDAEDMIKFIRETINSLYGSLSQKVRIQYGGSVKPSNIVELMEKEEIDGALVGGASLKAEDFVKLVNF